MPMSEEARKALNAYMREYRKRNPEKIRERQRIYNERYWLKKARQAKEAEQVKEENHDGGTQDVCENDRPE